jgi:tetratricopeptide (TPR) repeat protein
MQKPLVALEALHRFLDNRLQQHPTYVDVLNVRALSWTMQGDLDAARDDLAEALRLHPGYRDALINLVWLHTRRDEPGAFQAILQSRRVQDLPMCQRIHLELLGTQRWEGPAAALRAWQQLDAESRQHPWLALDGLWFAVRARSSTHLPAALKLLHAHHCEWAWHLQCVGEGDDTLHAKQSLESWALCYEGNPGMTQLLTAQLPLLEDQESVQGVLHWATLVSADLCGYWMQLGAHHDRYLRNDAAEEAYRKAVRVDPERATARLQLANLLAALGRAEDALEELEEVCRLQPEWADAHYLLGLLLESCGLMERAEEAYRLATVCNPDYLLPEIACGRLLAAQGRLDEALHILDAVRRKGLESLDLEEALVELHNALGNEAAARAARQRAERLALDSD